MSYYYIPSGPAPGMSGLGQLPGIQGGCPAGQYGYPPYCYEMCPEGQVLDPTTGGCIPISSCPPGHVPDPVTGGCIPMVSPCPEGYVPDPTTGGCIPMGLPDVPVPPGEEPPEPDVGTCPVGYVLDMNGQCVPADQPPVPPQPGCPEGMMMDPAGLCVPIAAPPPAEAEKPSLVVPIAAGLVGLGILIWVMKG
jgi:hypothetical protein